MQRCAVHTFGSSPMGCYGLGRGERPLRLQKDQELNSGITVRSRVMFKAAVWGQTCADGT